jgi:hypothetical protein
MEVMEMTADGRTTTRRMAGLVAAAVAIAVLTMSAAEWKWGFVLLYVAVAFVLEAAIRFRNVELERAIHVFVLAGSAPIVVRLFFGLALGAVELLHVIAVLITSIGVGSLLADRVRHWLRKPAAV